MNPSTCHKILIIDDELAILRLLSNILTRRGYHIDTAMNGNDGIKKFCDHAYNLVITDIKMPGISGEDLTYRIRQLKGKQIPVIAMSGTPWLMDKGLFDAVLPKPFSKEDLLCAIDAVLATE